MRLVSPVALVLVVAVGVGCAGDGAPVAAGGEPAASPEATAGPGPGAGDTVPQTAPGDAGSAEGAGGQATAGAANQRPPWLGTRVLPRRPDGFGEIRPTPPELVDRRLPPPPLLPPPDGAEFSATIQPVPDDVAARSTWSPACPVRLEDLRYLTVVFWAFDGRPHTGELLVHASVAEDLVTVFERLYAARFPIEEMRVVAAEELDAPPTGDGNNTSAFVCRDSTGGGDWSQHAYGLAVDVNPFHNPYVKGDVVVPELASAYADRQRRRPGMIAAGDEVTAAFAGVGWSWGGAWRSAKDWMHFSTTGR